MAAKKVSKGASFSKSSTKAGTAAYNAGNKLKIAKEALSKKKTEIKATDKAIAKGIKSYAKAKSSSARNAAGDMIEYNKFSKLPKQKAERGVLSQNVSDRTRTASRAAGIAKRVAKKSK
jgi:hypothetical protein